MNKTQMMKWENKRVKGKKNYIIFTGVLGWGIPVGIIYCLIYSILRNHTIKIDQDFFILFIISIVIFSICGIIYGLFTWYWFEKKYEASPKITD